MKTLIRTALAAITLSLAIPALAQTATPSPDPLDQIRAEHIMISTDDFDETVDWYRDMLGFEVVQEWTVPEFPGLKLGYIERNGFVIEIVETPVVRTTAPPRPANLAEALNDRGIGHLAFLVADVDEVAAELRARGVEFLVEPTSFPDSGRRLIFIFDNGGNILEFLTPLEAYEGREGE